MKTRSSVITPPPDLSVLDGALAITEDGLSAEDRNAILKKLVRKGAPSVSNEGTKTERDAARISVRLPISIRDRVHQAAGDKLTHMPVNTWIIEAILAQLKKEGF